MNFRLLLLTLATVLLAACAAQRGERQIYVPPSGGVQTQPADNTPILQPQPVTPGEGQAPPLSSYPRTLADTQPGAAVLALYQQAQEQARAGRFDQADAALERALRIAPRNPFVWQALANLHLRMKEYDQAASEAERANSLGHGNPYLEAGNWRTLAAIRRAQGDAAGALQAQQQAEALAKTLAQPQP